MITWRVEGVRKSITTLLHWAQADLSQGIIYIEGDDLSEE
jgi:hypothetical protein